MGNQLIYIVLILLNNFLKSNLLTMNRTPTDQQSQTSEQRNQNDQFYTRLDNLDGLF